MFNTYSESAENVLITKARVIKELKSHGITEKSEVEEFFADLGKPSRVDNLQGQLWYAHRVLAIIGY